jgi:hypothetical protein
VEVEETLSLMPAYAAQRQATPAPDANDQSAIDSLFDDFDAQSAAKPAEASATADVIAPPPPALVEAERPAPAHPSEALAAAPPPRPRARLSRPANQTSRLPLLAFSSALAAVGLVMATIAWRDDIVALAPQMAGVYEAVGLEVNLRGVDIVNVKSEMTQLEGAPVLVIRGEIVNRTEAERDIPALYLAVLDGFEREQYRWVAALEEKTIAPGATIQFRRRLASPPQEARKVLVRFAKASDPQSAGPVGGGEGSGQPLP